MSAITGSSQLGTMYVYREYKPKTNSVELTAYFWHNGVKCRLDAEGTREFWDRFSSSDEAARYAKWRFEKAVREGTPRPATDFVHDGVNIYYER